MPDSSCHPAVVPVAWLAGVLIILPVVLLPYPPLVDYPNHLARLFVLAHYEEVAAFQQQLEPKLRLIPNLGIEMLGMPILGVVEDPMIASRAILAVTAGLYFLGCQALGYAVLRRASWRATLAGLLFYGSTMLYGFLSYQVGLALFLFTLASWIDSRGRWTPTRLLACSLLAVAGYFAHLSFLALLCVAVGPLFLSDLSAAMRRSRATALLPLVPLLAVGAVALAFPPPPSSSAHIEWNSWLGKAVVLIGPIRTYSLRADVLFLLLIAILGALVVWRMREPAVRWPLAFAAAALVAGALATPLVAFGSFAADARFVLPSYCVGLFAFEARVERRAGLAMAALGVLIARLATVLVVWQELSRRTADMVELFDLLPSGSRVLVSFLPGADAEILGVDERKRVYAFAHVASYATLRRSAVTSNLFVNPYQTLASRNPDMGSERGDAEEIRRLEPLYDAVWAFRPPPEVRRALEAAWLLRGRAGDAELWQKRLAVPDEGP